MVPAYEVLNEVIHGPCGARIESDLEKLREEMNAYIDSLIAENRISKGEPEKVYITTAHDSSWYEKEFQRRFEVKYGSNA